ncbi:MAG: hypothetical protein ABUL63_04290 [Acidobacteriota bacterium]
MDANRTELQAAEITQLLAQSRPELEDLFRRRWVSVEEAEAILDEALSHLFFHGDRIDDPASRLPAVADRIIRVRLESPLFLEEDLK